MPVSAARGGDLGRLPATDGARDSGFDGRRGIPRGRVLTKVPKWSSTGTDGAWERARRMDRGDQGESAAEESKK